MSFMIDAVTGGALMNKIEEEEHNLIAKMTLNNYQWSNERITSKKAGVKFDANALTLLTTKIDAITQRLECLTC